MFDPSTMKALRVHYQPGLWGTSAYEWRFMSLTLDPSARVHFPNGVADGKAKTGGAAFLAASAFAGWARPSEMRPGELEEHVNMFVNVASYPERELWVEASDSGWRGQIIERGAVLFEVDAPAPGEAALLVSLKALDAHSKETVSVS